MTITTTTPPPARGGATGHKKHCQYCGDHFYAKMPHQKYCGPDCSYGAALRKGAAKRHYPYQEAEQALAELKANQPARVVPVRRAATLAETPDVPAVKADRGDYLTGGAAATMQATSGGRIGVV